MDETKVQIGEDVLLDIGTHSDWYISAVSYDGESVNVDLRRKAARHKEWWLADTPQTDLVEDSPSLVKDLVKAFGEDGTWLERQGVYTLTLAEAKQRAVDIIESVIAKDEPQTDCAWR